MSESSRSELSGHVALVTGATSGLGRRFAITLAAAGAKVAVAGRRADRLDALAGEIADAGGTALPIAMDMADADSIAAGVAQASDRLGTVDILVNNAGIVEPAYAAKMTVEAIDRQIAVNLRGPFILACDVGRRLIAAKKPGRVVNISSMAAFHYDGGASVLYAVAKAGIARMTEALAVEWSRFHINVNGIAPGNFHSEMMAAAIERVGDMSDKMPRGRICEPSQLDTTLLYLCSPASDAVTGTIIRVDDGQFAR